MIKPVTIAAISILLIIISCKQKNAKESEDRFTVKVDSLRIDTPLIAAVSYQGYLLCLKESKQFLVLDEQLQQVKEKESILNNYRPLTIFLYKDTIILAGKKDLFYLDENFKVKSFRLIKEFEYGFPLYSDSLFTVNSCSVGEFGSTISFISQKDGKYYSCPSNNVEQVIWFNGKYILSCYLAHLSGLSSFMEVQDPYSLYELKKEESKRFCNWQYNDSILKGEGITLTDNDPKGVVTYFDTISTPLVSTFQANGELYTVLSNKTHTLLGRHVNRKLQIIDTLRSAPLKFNHTKSLYHDNRLVTVYNYGIGSAEGDKVIYNKKTGLVLYSRGTIHFLDFYGIKPTIEKMNNN